MGVAGVEGGGGRGAGVAAGTSEGVVEEVVGAEKVSWKLSFAK